MGWLGAICFTSQSPTGLLRTGFHTWSEQRCGKLGKTNLQKVNSTEQPPSWWGTGQQDALLSVQRYQGLVLIHCNGICCDTEAHNLVQSQLTVCVWAPVTFSFPPARRWNNFRVLWQIGVDDDGSFGITEITSLLPSIKLTSAQVGQDDCVMNCVLVLATPHISDGFSVCCGYRKTVDYAAQCLSRRHLEYLNTSLSGHLSSAPVNWDLFNYLCCCYSSC